MLHVLRSSDANAELYASNGSLVIRSDGRTVRSNPGMATATNVVGSYNRDRPCHNPTSYCEEQLPLSVHSSPTLVISEDTRLAFNNAFSSSNAAMTLMSPLIGGSLGHHPIEMCSSPTSLTVDCGNSLTTDFLNANSFQPVFPVTGFPADFDVASDMDLGETFRGSSHMVTGFGTGGGGEGMILDDEFLQLMDKFDPLLPQCDPVPVFEDDTNLSDLIRKLEEPSPLRSADLSGLVHPPDMEVFQATPFDPLSATICSDYVGEPVQVQPRDKALSESHFWNGSLESTQQQSAIGDDLLMIKMMSMKSKPVLPMNLLLEKQIDVENADAVSAVAMSTSVKLESASPLTSLSGPFSPCPEAPHNFATYGIQAQTPISPIQVSAPSPAPIPTPMTPVMTPHLPSPKGPFEIDSYMEGGRRDVVVSIRDDVPDAVKKMAYEMNCFSASMYRKYMACLSKNVDLNVAIDTKAKLCEFDLDRTTGRLVFSMPKDCK